MAGDLQRTLTSLARAHTRLDLETDDLCFIIALRTTAERQVLVSFDEEMLVQTYLQVAAVIAPDAENPRLRATHAIQHLRDLRLLTRVDPGGLVRSGDFALTDLANAIADFYYRDETLTRESLTLLTRTLVATLVEIRQAARIARHADDWKGEVVLRLRVVAGDLLAGIDSRQRGLDAAQEEVRGRIARLLRDDWFAAIAACESLLEDMALTLRELAAILLQDSSRLQELLQDIESLATKDGARDASLAARRVAEEVDRVVAWGVARQRAWSDYYQYVSRFLRDVVRLDPQRALSQRLRDQLHAFPDAPFHAVVADAPRIMLLRTLEAWRDRPPVTRAPSQEQALAVVSATPGVDLPAIVERVLATRPASLARALRRVLPAVPADERFEAIGHVTALVAARAPIAPTSTPDATARIRPWREVDARFEVEDWDVAWEGDARPDDEPPGPTEASS
ncbi:MAG: condensin subunit MukF [Deltaproteobacteria bacterium]|nr:condensin subunit MukF [Deltaproteobacteria bacterium]